LPSKKVKVVFIIGEWIGLASSMPATPPEWDARAGCLFSGGPRKGRSGYDAARGWQNAGRGKQMRGGRSKGIGVPRGGKKKKTRNVFSRGKEGGAVSW